MNRLLYALSFSYIFFLSFIYAGTIDPHTPDSKYIEYGKDFHYVGKLCGEDEENNKFCASAVAIDDHNILTAAHVVHNAKICRITINDKKILVTKIIINKDFEKIFGKADIAIGHCEDPIGLKFYPALYTDRDEVGKLCSISGYGLHGTFETGIRLSDNNRRAGSNRIDETYNNLLVCTPSHRNSKGYTSLEFIIGSGDSGGGLFIDNKLAGINSCVMSIEKVPNSTYGDESGHTRISDFVDWIEENKYVNKK